MRTILKYDVAIGRFEVKMPTGARVLDAQGQDGRPVMWVQTWGEPTLEKRIFQVFGTGQEIPQDLGPEMFKYRATFQMGPMVWHLYEVDILPF